jgi:predicted RNase H-like HicB family nuclease
MPTVLLTLYLPATFEHEGPWIVGRFPDIDVTSQGKTREEAERNLVEAAQLFMESCYERDVLDEVLKQCGFTPGHADSPPGEDYLTVPVELLATRNGSASHPR